MRRYRLVVQPLVYEQIEEFIHYIAQSSLRQAERFIQAAQDALDGMIAWPGPLSKARLLPDHPELNELRRWNIADFPNHTFLYDMRGDAVVVLQCVHASRITDRFLSGLS